jgi:UTP-glucose-1-phosphate uridylyltransferase
MHGQWDTARERFLHIDSFVEKPTINYAEESLGVKDKSGNEHYYSVFGQYVLTSDVYDQLRADIDAATDITKEIELTSAIEKVRSKTGLVGVRINGRMFDMGNPKALQECSYLFSK